MVRNVKCICVKESDVCDYCDGGLKMKDITVGELKKALEEFDDDEGVIIWFKWKGDSVCDSAVSMCRNGNAIQICGRTIDE